MTRFLPATVLAASIACPPALALGQAADRQAAEVEAGTYAMDPNHTQIVFSVMHMGFTPYYGRFSSPSGTLVLSPKVPAESKLTAIIPAATISTTSDKLDGELKGQQWLDVAKYPQVTFRSTKIVPTSKDSAKVTGDLTLHGVTKPVTLDVHFVGAGINPLDKTYTVGFQATGEISRSDFDVKTYVPLIGDAVQITLSGAFERQG